MKKAILILVLAFMPFGVSADSVIHDFGWLDQYTSPPASTYRNRNETSTRSWSSNWAPVPRVRSRGTSSAENYMEKWMSEQLPIRQPRQPSHEEICRFLAPPGGDRQFCLEN